MRKSQYINFSGKNVFDIKTRCALGEAHRCLEDLSNQEGIKTAFSKVKTAFETYYGNEHVASNAFDQFIQYIIESLCLGINNQPNREKEAVILNCCLTTGSLFHTVWATASGSTALHSACRNGYEAVVRKLIVFAEKEHTLEDLLMNQDQNGFSCLNATAFAGHLSIFKMLLQSATRIFREDKVKLYRFLTSVTSLGVSPLNHAAVRGYTEIVIEIMECLESEFGRDAPYLKSILFQTNDYGTSPVKSAVLKGDPDSVECMVSCIRKASANYRSELVSYLSEHDNRGETLVRFAKESFVSHRNPHPDVKEKYIDIYLSLITAECDQDKISKVSSNPSILWTVAAEGNSGMKRKTCPQEKKTDNLGKQPPAEEKSKDDLEDKHSNKRRKLNVKPTFTRSSKSTRSVIPNKKPEAKELASNQSTQEPSDSAELKKPPRRRVIKVYSGL